MPHVAPFVGLRYDTDIAGDLSRLTAPPYDVISGSRRDHYLAASPYNVVHVDLSEGSDDPDHAESRYARAGALLAEWEHRDVLRRDPDPTYYAYELAWTPETSPPGGTIRGVFVALALEPWGGSVLPHEHTMPGPIADRLHLLRATATHLSPIYGTVSGPCDELAALLGRTCGTPPAAEVTDEEGVRHRLWTVERDEPIDRWLAPDDLLIADGHHRYTTALAYRDERHAVDGPGPWDTILAFVVDTGTEDVPVLPYHRIQRSGEAPAIEQTAHDLDELLGSVDDDASRVGIIVARDGATAYGTLTLRGRPPAVRALHEELLDHLAPGETRRFTHDVLEAEAAVRAGDATAAYVLAPTTPARILAAVEHGDRLPRKSTFFWPKPRTGLLFMPVR